MFLFKNLGLCLFTLCDTFGIEVYFSGYENLPDADVLLYLDHGSDQIILYSLFCLTTTKTKLLILSSLI